MLSSVTADYLQTVFAKQALVKLLAMGDIAGTVEVTMTVSAALLQAPNCMWSSHVGQPQPLQVNKALSHQHLVP